jgi:F-type H+-transporting ATPase subunit gamma
MPTVKEYNVKLGRLRSTRKMTKTMKMVSANKLRKTQAMVKQSEIFKTTLDRCVRDALRQGGGETHPLLQARPVPAPALILVLTSDRGLCAGFNNNLIRLVVQWLDANREQHPDSHLSCYGARGYQFFREHHSIRKYYQGVSAKPEFGLVRRIARDLENAFLSGRYSHVFLAYNVFRSALTQKPVMEQLLPMQFPAAGVAGGLAADVLHEPSGSTVRNRLLSQAVAMQVYHAFLQSAAGEHGARMTAMDNSTASAGKLIDSYSLLRNRARQAGITRELTEIVAGAEALK